MLRSIRYGEADRILHLYTPDHGRLGAIAKGARRARSRFGARLEPFFQIRLRAARGSRRPAHGHRRPTRSTPARACGRAPIALDAAARACDAVARLFETDDPHPEVFTLLANELTLLARQPAATESPLPYRANALAFRLKLLLAAGIVPQLGSCASCGEREHLTGFSAAAGGVVCSSCESAAFPLDQEAYEFLVDALGRPLAEAPAGLGAGAAPGRAGDPRDRRAPRARAPAAAAAAVRIAARDRFRCLTNRPRRDRVDEHPDGPVAEALRGADQAREAAELSPLATRSYPARRARAEPDCGLRTPFQRDRDRIVHCKAFRRLKHKTQVFVLPEGRPLPHPADAHARGHAGLADGRPRAGAQRGSRRGDRPRPRPRAPAVRPHRRGGARQLPVGAVRRSRSGTTSTRCGWSTCSSATARGLNLTDAGASTGSAATRGGRSSRRRSRAGSSASSTGSPTSTTTSTTPSGPA